MMKYPKNCAILTEEEMEYTTGGGALGAIMLIGGLAGGVFSGMLASRQLNQIKADLKANDPDAYLPESAEMTKKLEQDAKKVFNDSAAGLAINVAQFISGVCIGGGFVSVIMTAMVGNPVYVPDPIVVPNGNITIPK